jgi:hypothetical protein
MQLSSRFIRYYQTDINFILVVCLYKIYISTEHIIGQYSLFINIAVSVNIPISTNKWELIIYALNPKRYTNGSTNLYRQCVAHPCLFAARFVVR